MIHILKFACCQVVAFSAILHLLHSSCAHSFHTVHCIHPSHMLNKEIIACRIQCKKSFVAVLPKQMTKNLNVFLQSFFPCTKFASCNQSRIQSFSPGGEGGGIVNNDSKFVLTCLWKACMNLEMELLRCLCSFFIFF